MQNNNINNTQTYTDQSNQQSINLDNVSNNFIDYIFKHKFVFIVLLVISIGFIYLNFVISIAIILVALTASKAMYENNLFKAFANSNNFTYSKKGIVPAQRGHLFFIGNSQKITDVVDGKYNNWPFLLFLYTYDIGYGRDRQTYHRAVFTVDFNTMLPTFILRRHRTVPMLNDEGDRIKSNGYTEKLQLEGDFNQHLQVFIAPNTGQDVLTILTPDLMELLVKLGKYEIELTPEGIFYIYTFHFISNKKELLDIYNIFQLVVSKVSYKVNQTQKVDQLKQQSTQIQNL